MGKPPKKNYAENEQFPVSVEVQQLDSAEDYRDSLPKSGCKNFAPSTVVTVRTEKNSADDDLCNRLLMGKYKLKILQITHQRLQKMKQMSLK